MYPKNPLHFFGYVLGYSNSGLWTELISDDDNKKSCISWKARNSCECLLGLTACPSFPLVWLAELYVIYLTTSLLVCSFRGLATLSQDYSSVGMWGRRFLPRDLSKVHPTRNGKRERHFTLEDWWEILYGLSNTTHTHDTLNDPERHFCCFATVLASIPEALVSTLSLYMNREAHIASDFKCIIETEGHLKVTGCHTHCKIVNVLKTVQDRDFVTIEVIYYLLNNGNFNDLYWPLRTQYSSVLKWVFCRPAVMQQLIRFQLT